jgi:hypothetical protein
MTITSTIVRIIKEHVHNFHFRVDCCQGNSNTDQPYTQRHA